MKKRNVEILIAVLVLLGVIVLLWLLLRGDKPLEIIDRQPQSVPSDDLFFDEPVAQGDPIVMPQPIARTFVERFASFSTEADYSNVDDVMGIATADLRIALQGIAEEARAEQSGAYYGVSTHVLTMNVVEETDASATLAMTTQRKESFGSPGNTQVRYQDIVVSLIREGDDWFVSSFTWQ